MQSQLLYFDDERAAALRLAEASGLPAASVERHRFPDDELRLRLPLAEGEAIAEQLVLYRGLDHPNESWSSCCWWPVKRAAWAPSD